MPANRLQVISATGQTVTSLTATLPQGTSVGSLVVGYLNVKGNNTTITAPAGWNAVPGTPTSPGTQSLTVGLFYQAGAAAGQSSFTFTFGSAQNAVLIVEEWAGVAPYPAFDVGAFSNDPNGGQTQTIGPTATAPAAAGELSLVAHGYNNATQRSVNSNTAGYSQSIVGGVFTATNSGLFAFSNPGLPDANPVSFTDTLSAATGGGQVLALAVFKLAGSGGTTGNPAAAGASIALKQAGKTTQAGATVAVKQTGAGTQAGASVAVKQAGLGAVAGASVSLGAPAATLDAGASLALKAAAVVAEAGASLAVKQAGASAQAGASVSVRGSVTAGHAQAGASISLADQIPPPPPPLTGLKVIHQGQDISEFVIEQNDGDTLHTARNGGLGSVGGGGGQDDFSVISVLGQGAGVGAGGSGAATTCSFSVWLGPAASAIGQNQTPSGTDLVRQGDVQVYDARGSLIFGGVAVSLEDATDSINPKTRVTCQDYWQHLDRIQVNERFFGKGDVTIIKSLLTTYAPMIDQSHLPDADNITYPDRLCKDTLRAVIQKLADESGWMVWVDPAKAMHYVSPTAASSAPFGLSDDPDSVTTQGHALTKYTIDDTALINRVTFYGGKSTSPDFTQDLSPQVNGVNKTFLIAYYPHNTSDGHTHLVKNGVELSVGSVFDTSDAGKFKSQGGTSDALINADSKVIMFDVAPLATDTLTFAYRYQTPLVIILSNQQSYNFYGGWYDGRITDTNVFDTNLALQRCRVLLAQQAFGLVSVAATTWTPGIQAGQLLHVVNSIKGIDDSFLVQKVTTKPLGGGEFEYDIELGAWNWNLLDILVQNARILNPTDSNTEEDVTVIQAKESVTAATVEIVFTKTTHASGQYYSGQPGTNSGFFTVTD